MIGNYGVDDARLESPQPWVQAVLMRRCGGDAWAQWLTAKGIVALDDLDTRKLVLRIRDAGAMRAAAGRRRERSRADEALELISQQPTMEGQALVSAVSSVEPSVYNEDGRVSGRRVVDYGAKTSIMRRLRQAGAAVPVVHARRQRGRSAGFDGVMLSNGPGDRSRSSTMVARSATCWDARACSASASGTSCSGSRPATRLQAPFGHRGAKPPGARALDPDASSSRARTTVSPSLPRTTWKRPYVSLYDGTVEGSTSRS
jgi:carbamoyl-phosphate synthase small subunit